MVLTKILVILTSLVSSSSACSNFILQSDDYSTISGRTMDFGFWEGFSLETVPIGHSFHTNPSNMSANIPAPNTLSKYGFLGIYASSPKSAKGVSRGVVAGMNSAGLTCDLQTLIGTSYPKYNETSDASITPIDVLVFCEWALANFESTQDVANSVLPENNLSDFIVVGPDAFGCHFVLRDASGSSIVIEFIDGNTLIHLDHNDGVTGFGIMTNEPPYPWHVENTLHMDWKRGMARPAVAIPGGFYPDERFLRLHLLKEGLNMPSSYRDKIQQSLHLLDSVTVTPGKIPGTDSGAGEGPGDHTVFALVYDHGIIGDENNNATLYWRTYADHSLQRAVLSDLGIEDEAAPIKRLNMANELPWFTDASSSFV